MHIPSNTRRLVVGCRRYDHVQRQFLEPKYRDTILSCRVVTRCLNRGLNVINNFHHIIKVFRSLVSIDTCFMNNLMENNKNQTWQNLVASIYTQFWPS